MRNCKQYKCDSIFGFGKYKGKTVEEVLEKMPSYISWCFQNVERFCITDEIFEKLPEVTFLRENERNGEELLQKLIDIHSHKKKLLQNQSVEFNDIEFDVDDYRYEDSRPYFEGDPRFDRNENPWIDVFGEGEEAEAAYWNTH